MKTINDVKEACRKVIELAERATPGKWSSRKEYFDRDEPAKYANYEVFPHTDGLKKPDIGDWSALATCESYEPKNKDNAAFIAITRTFTPAAAQALLVAIEALERLAVEPHTKHSDTECSRCHAELAIESILSTFQKSDA